MIAFLVPMPVNLELRVAINAKSAQLAPTAALEQFNQQVALAETTAQHPPKKLKESVAAVQNATKRPNFWREHATLIFIAQGDQYRKLSAHKAMSVNEGVNIINLVDWGKK